MVRVVRGNGGKQLARDLDEPEQLRAVWGSARVRVGRGDEGRAEQELAEQSQAKPDAPGPC